MTKIRNIDDFDPLKETKDLALYTAILLGLMGGYKAVNKTLEYLSEQNTNSQHIETGRSEPYNLKSDTVPYNQIKDDNPDSSKTYSPKNPAEKALEKSNIYYTGKLDTSVKNATKSNGLEIKASQ